ncbi:putative hydro-lyase [Nesterenkonia sp. HG001]|uniref:putative hydro-lyase n=1 Tax=Nesterenkonia sp. HG001 TaxID=2983207 RepID=UPI002AC499F5|nr:putative hydro-lyase [Nesterenkonia sp. HG001]MDZ5077760.1 putative hydro-lyase [Nesterenkonia sp. HG001]
MTPPPESLSPTQAREAFRTGLRAPTSGYAPGFAQANVLALPKDLAFDMLLFAQRNPKPCPVLGVLEPGQVTSGLLAGGDIRTDVPAYRVYRDGELVAEPDDVLGHWRDDLVTFLLGCSFTFETPLRRAGVPVRHLDLGVNVPMYRTARRCAPAGSLSGPLVVSMRPIPAHQVADAVRITSRYPGVHGAPMHVGNPAALGIEDLDSPDFGDAVDVPTGWIPVFWACGVTPQAAVMESKPELAISHSPGHMLVTDLPDAELQVP